MRFLLSLVSHVISAAAALLIANWILPQVTLRVSGFVVAVVVFAVAQSVLGPFIFNLARQYASAVLGGIGLVSTLVALWVATLFPDGLTITGLGWALAPLVVWIATALGGWILMGLVFKRTLQKHDQGKKGAS
ncbi:phage holin family protein [Leucobacter aridicollis]|uniref:phage holin family protein n=1 Tax=Leucobacter aridicollis TaxID=283878 RepID=UPI002169C890|nr:phage holin family protein [Leucobacter aridicollis]MCS3428056.1 hypothetical protein [Leucobacter aridicollis]